MGFDDDVNSAIEKLRGSFPGAKISASVNGKVVTLKGDAPDMNTKGRIMEQFNKLVKTENTVNQISIPKPAAPAAAASAPMPSAGGTAPRAAGGPRVHEVAKGDTLSAISKKYYGDANKYMKIFEANRNILNDPNKIKPGQKLNIPD